MTETSYIAVKKSQVWHYTAAGLYEQTENGAFVLYKSEDEEIDIKRFADERYPQLYIREKDRAAALKDLQRQLQKKLVTAVQSGELSDIKSVLIEIVQEALTEPLDSTLPTLPETVDIVYSKHPGPKGQAFSLLPP